MIKRLTRSKLYSLSLLAILVLCIWAVLGFVNPGNAVNEKTGSLRVYSSNIGGLKAVSGRIYVTGLSGDYDDFSTDKPVTLPTGEYELSRFRLITESGVTLFGKFQKPLTIEAGKQTNIDISGPLKLEVTRLIGAANQIGNISWRIKVGDIAYIDNVDGLPNPPVVRFYGNDGKLINTAPMEYSIDHFFNYPVYNVIIPSLPVGRYKFDVTFNLGADTKPLTTSAELKVRDFDMEAYEKYFTAYNHAPRGGDTSEQSNARQKLLDCFKKNTVEPGEAVRLSDKLQVSEGAFLGPDKFSATLTWNPEADALRLEMDVIDAYYSISPDEDKPWDASSVEVLFCPFNGGRYDVTQITFNPTGSDGKARIFPSYIKGVSATWSRTEKGYIIKANIPWNAILGFQKGSPLLPVQAQINTNTPNGSASLAMTELGEPWATVTYAGLLLPNDIAP